MDIQNIYQRCFINEEPLTEEERKYLTELGCANESKLPFKLDMSALFFLTDAELVFAVYRAVAGKPKHPTGMRDKNGREIMLGDHDGNGNVVEFMNGTFNINGDRPLKYLLAVFEVKGNISDKEQLKP